MTILLGCSLQCETTRLQAQQSTNTNTTPANTCNLQAPRLLTSTRNRPRSCKSQQEIEEEELQQQFKARPVE